MRSAIEVAMRLVSAVVLVLFLSYGSSFAASSVTLQEGVNGYTGCSDTYVKNVSNDTVTLTENFGLSDTIVVKEGKINC